MAILKHCNRCEQRIGVFKNDEEIPAICERCKKSPNVLEILVTLFIAGMILLYIVY